jgi:hypothetical protein
MPTLLLWSPCKSPLKNISLLDCEFYQIVSGTVFLRVARWLVFEPKIHIWVNFGGYCNGRCWYSLYLFGIFYSHLVNLMAIWFCIFSGYLVFFPFENVFANKNLATLVFIPTVCLSRLQRYPSYGVATGRPFKYSCHRCPLSVRFWDATQ